MKRTYINKFTKGLTAVALVLGMASCSDDLDYELFTKYTYLMNNGWQENIEMEIAWLFRRERYDRQRQGHNHNACR